MDYFPFLIIKMSTTTSTATSTTATCPRCGHEFFQLSNYKKHLMNVKMCPPYRSTISLDGERSQLFVPKAVICSCDDCGKGFSTKRGLTIHVAKHCKPLVVSDCVPDRTPLVDAVRPNDFGYENIEFIEKSTLIELVEKGRGGIMPLVKLIYMNPLHPENHNYFIKNASKDTGIVFSKNEWIPLSSTTITDKMVSFALMILKNTVFITQWTSTQKDECYLDFCKVRTHVFSRIKNEVRDLILLYQANRNRLVVPSLEADGETSSIHESPP